MILQYLCATLLRLASGEGGEIARGKNERRRVAARSTAANALEPRAQSGKMPDQQTRTGAAGLGRCVQFREDRMIKTIGMGAGADLTIVRATPPAVAWEPNKPVEIVVAAGAGGASDQMARMMQAAIQKNNLMKQPMVAS